MKVTLSLISRGIAHSNNLLLHDMGTHSELNSGHRGTYICDTLLRPVQ